ncbi:MAG: fumarylacetoacetate hydrolase family protein [Candidatus Binataceae bacterium]
MKLCTFEIDTPIGAVRRIGMLTAKGHILDLNAAYESALAGKVGLARAQALAEAILPPDMLGFIANGPIAREALEQARSVLAGKIEETTARGPRGGRMVWDEKDIRLIAPIPRPNSMRDCLAFEEHLKNALKGQPIAPVWYEVPIYYKGNRNSIQGTGSEVVWPSYTEQLDYELEFAAIIGRQGVNAPPEKAWDLIFGYTIFNDVSARDIQFKEMAAHLGPAKGKDMDGGNLMGPYLVTADEWDPRDDHAMTARVNGEKWGGGTTKAMHHDFGKIVSYISNDETLYPGDIIGSGTVGTGCGLEIGRYPKPGDLIELEIEGLGKLSCRYVKPRR